MNKISKIIMWLAAALFVWDILPVFAGIHHPGLLLVAGVCAVVFVWMMFYGKLKAFFAKTKPRRFFYTAIKVVCAVAVAGFVAMSAVMLSPVFTAAPENLTVVVPGAQINGDFPSLMLSRRLDKAAEYLSDNPETLCVTTGGRGVNEQYSEAEVMKKYLIEQKEIEENRIFAEENSFDTEHNFLYTAELIRQNGMGSEIVITTDLFHSYRCTFEARKQNLTPYAYPCNTDWFLFPGYWVREMMAIGKAWFLE